jgi:hypothetical protein
MHTRVQKLAERRAVQCVAQLGGRRQPRVAEVARLRKVVQVVALFGERGERGADELGLDRLEKVRLRSGQAGGMIGTRMYWHLSANVSDSATMNKQTDMRAISHTWHIFDEHAIFFHCLSATYAAKVWNHQMRKRRRAAELPLQRAHAFRIKQRTVEQLLGGRGREVEIERGRWRGCRCRALAALELLRRLAAHSDAAWLVCSVHVG